MALSSMAKLALRERTRREIVQKSELIPSLPDVVVEVLRLVADKGAEIQQFEDLLRNDGPLVAKMLRVVNSPFYAVASPVRSIGKAVMVLGFRSLRSLVLAASTGNYMERDYRCYGFDSKGLWKHAVAVASGARTIAKELRQSPDMREEIFVAGLLHDIGKLLLAPYLREAGVDIDMFGDESAQEEAVLGIDHQEAGTVVAEKWGMSPLVHHAIRKHGGREPEEEYKESWAILELAHSFALGEAIGATAEAPPAPIEVNPVALEVLGLDEDAWLDLKVEVRIAVEGAVVSLANLGS